MLFAMRFFWFLLNSSETFWFLLAQTGFREGFGEKMLTQFSKINLKVYEKTRQKRCSFVSFIDGFLFRIL